MKREPTQNLKVELWLQKVIGMTSLIDRQRYFGGKAYTIERHWYACVATSYKCNPYRDASNP